VASRCQFDPATDGAFYVPPIEAPITQSLAEGRLFITFYTKEERKLF
jgi:hypothetical protein